MSIDVRTETIITVADAARRLNKSSDTIKAWIRRGLLEGIKIAGKLHTSLEAIERVSEPVGPVPKKPATGMTVAEQKEYDERQKRSIEYLKSVGVAR